MLLDIQYLVIEFWRISSYWRTLYLAQPYLNYRRAIILKFFATQVRFSFCWRRCHSSSCMLRPLHLSSQLTRIYLEIAYLYWKDSMENHLWHTSSHLTQEPLDLIMPKCILLMQLFGYLFLGPPVWAVSSCPKPKNERGQATTTTQHHSLHISITSNSMDSLWTSVTCTNN